MAAPPYQGSRPSLADYAPLGLSDSELWRLPQRLSAVDVSPSGPKNGCSAVPGLTPFAGRLRPVGAVGFEIVDVASAHRPSMRPLQGRSMAAPLYQGSRLILFS